MARLPRLVVPGLAHYLILRAHPGLAGGICADEADRAALLSALREAARAEGAQVHAYALLHDEVQMLLTPNDPASPGRLVQALGRRYVSAYNRRHARSGTLWEGRFRCAVVEPGDTLLSALRLIDGLSAEPGVTSAQHRSGGPREAWLVDPPELWKLGNTPFDREAAYRSLISLGLPQTAARDLRRKVLGGWPVGSDAFVAGLAAGSTRPAAPRPRGRPRRAPLQS